MRHRLFEFEGRVARTDFRKKPQRAAIKDQFDKLLGLLKAHARHEEEEHVALLKKGKSSLHDMLPSEHEQQDKTLEHLARVLNQLMESPSESIQKQLGYTFYLSYTAFVSDYLQHLIQEERDIMPELWALYTDDELRELTFGTYRQMTLEDMIGMLETLFPHINAYEREMFLLDIKQSTPDLMAGVWNAVGPGLPPEERGDLLKVLGHGGSS